MNTSRDMPSDCSPGPEDSYTGLNFALALSACVTPGVIVIDGHHCIRAFNSVAEKLLQRPASEVLGQSIDVLPRTLCELLRQVPPDATPVDPHQLTVETENGGSLKLTVNVNVVEGDPPGLIVTVNDATAAQSLEQKVQQLDRLASIGTLSASMAHEIKNALVAIQTFVELLVNQNKDSELADIVSREMKRIDAIVSQMLRFAGPAKPTFSLVRVHDVLGHALKLIQHQVDGKKVTLHKNLAAHTDVVRGDGYQIEQALLNVLFNALEAVGANGELTVATDILAPSPATEKSPGDNGANLRVLIKDNGIGIAPHDLGKLFEPFYTTKSHGTGLGLSITRRIIQEHRGNIQVESDLNKGSSFSLLLPLASVRRAK